MLLQRTQEERRQREVASQLIIVAVSVLVYCHLSFDTLFNICELTPVALYGVWVV